MVPPFHMCLDLLHLGSFSTRIYFNAVYIMIHSWIIGFGILIWSLDSVSVFIFPVCDDIEDLS